jgi:hypothetical protein
MSETGENGTAPAETPEAQRNLPHLLTELGREVADGAAKAAGGYVLGKAIEKVAHREPRDAGSGGPKDGGPGEGGGEPGATA